MPGVLRVPTEVAADLDFQLYLRKRIILVGDVINDKLTSDVIAQLLYHDQEGPTQEVELRVNSAGGSVACALAIYDCMQMVRCPLRTLCQGKAHGAAALLVAAGAPGLRGALPYSRFHLSDPYLEGERTPDLARLAKTITTVNELYAKLTGRPLEEIALAHQHGLSLDAQEALEYGLIDRLVERAQ